MQQLASNINTSYINKKNSLIITIIIEPLFHTHALDLAELNKRFFFTQISPAPLSDMCWMVLHICKFDKSSAPVSVALHLSISEAGFHLRMVFLAMSDAACSNC